MHLKGHDFRSRLAQCFNRLSSMDKALSNVEGTYCSDDRIFQILKH